MKKLLLALLLLFPTLGFAQNQIAEGLQALHESIAWSAESGDKTAVAAVTGKKIKLLGFIFGTDTTTSLFFKSGSTALNDALPFTAGVSSSANPWGVQITNKGEALVVNSSAAITGSIWVTYALVD